MTTTSKDGARWQGIRWLVTYSQCGDLSAEKVGLMFSNLGAECLIAHEWHEDGGDHLHCYVEFEQRFRTRNPRVFDVDGCHPQMEVIKKTPWKAYDYVTKDGDVRWGGAARPRETGQPTTAKETNNALWSGLRKTKSAAEFMAYAYENFPKESVLQLKHIEYACQQMFPPIIEEHQHPGYIKFHEHLLKEALDWVENHLKSVRAPGMCEHRFNMFSAIRFCPTRGAFSPPHISSGDPPSLRGDPIPLPHSGDHSRVKGPYGGAQGIVWSCLLFTFDRLS